MTQEHKIQMTYLAMRNRTRTEGRYFGLSLPDRDAFFEWAINDPLFNELFDNQTCRKDTPSIDRIDSTQGYGDLGNLRWVTLSKNSGRSKAQEVLNTETGEVYESITRAAAEVGMSRQTLARQLRGYTKKQTTKFKLL